MDQLLFLKSDGFSFLKRESKDIVACRFAGANLLCFNKNFCFLVIFYFYDTPISLENQVFYQKPLDLFKIKSIITVDL